MAEALEASLFSSEFDAELVSTESRPKFGSNWNIFKKFKKIFEKS